MNIQFWNDKRVLITGHTGFKGGWACLALKKFGAQVFGLALPNEAENSLYKNANISQTLDKEYFIDITNGAQLASAIVEIQPDVIIHMAAQSLVHESYATPYETYNTNIMGTINLLEAAKQIDKKCAIVNVTSDKCYENQEWNWPYRESDPMGGHDPYSCSKGCVELITASYRKSFFTNSNILLASARAGNVIGGGDWAQNRLIPDMVRAHYTEGNLVIRSPNATRPWQFVLEPISGYFSLAEKLYSSGEEFAKGWNFGPNDSANQTVSWVVKRFADLITSKCDVIFENHELHEATLLKLDSSNVKAYLKWEPHLDIEAGLEWTAKWYAEFERTQQMHAFSLAQIEQYFSLSKGE
ncbi:MAG: CDP-glucose 4,6-dehydratase [Nitratireductor sp.]